MRGAKIAINIYKFRVAYSTLDGVYGTEAEVIGGGKEAGIVGMD